MKNKLFIILIPVFMTLNMCTSDKAIYHEVQDIAAKEFYKYDSSYYHELLKKNRTFEETKNNTLVESEFKTPFHSIRLFKVKLKNSEPSLNDVIYYSNKNKGIFNFQLSDSTGIDTFIINQINVLLSSEPALSYNQFKKLIKTIFDMYYYINGFYTVNNFSDIKYRLEINQKIKDEIKKVNFTNQNDVYSSELFCVNVYTGFLYKILIKCEYNQLSMKSLCFGQVAETTIEL